MRSFVWWWRTVQISSRVSCETIRVSANLYRVSWLKKSCFQNSVKFLQCNPSPGQLFLFPWTNLVCVPNSYDETAAYHELPKRWENKKSSSTKLSAGKVSSRLSFIISICVTSSQNWKQHSSCVILSLTQLTAVSKLVSKGNSVSKTSLQKLWE